MLIDEKNILIISIQSTVQINHCSIYMVIKTEMGSKQFRNMAIRKDLIK